MMLLYANDHKTNRRVKQLFPAYHQGEPMNTQEVIDLEGQVLLQTYAQAPFVIDYGRGVYLYDIDGNRYLDFVGGIAVNAFGHGDKEIVKAISEQAALLIHASNLRKGQTYGCFYTISATDFQAWIKQKLP